MRVRIKLCLAYDGTSFHGWQVQDNAVTVQGTLLRALEKLYKKPVELHGCSRTDAGVHARSFICHMDVDTFIPLDKLPIALNCLLPETVSVISAETVKDDFHSRYDVKNKTYRYYIRHSQLRDPFRADKCLFWNRPLDHKRFIEGCRYFIGKKDFAAFMAAGSNIRDPVRTVFDCIAFENGEDLVFSVTADGFLYNMVRIMVGTLIKYSQDEDYNIPAVIASLDRTRAGFTAPPGGLYLWEVQY